MYPKPGEKLEGGMLYVALEHLVFAQALLAQVKDVPLGDVRPNLADVVWEVEKRVRTAQDRVAASDER